MHRRSFLIGAVALMVSAQALPKPKEEDASRLTLIHEGNDAWNTGFTLSGGPNGRDVRFVRIDGKLYLETEEYAPGAFRFTA